MNATDKAVLYHEMAKLTGADFHLDRSVELLLDQGPPTARRMWLAGVAEGLRAGQGITDAIRDGKDVDASELELALISAGEKSGRLEQAFEHLGHYYESVAEGASKAKSALIYPLILAHLAILVPAVPALVLGTPGGGWWGIILPVAILWGAIAAMAFAWGYLAQKAQTSSVVDGWLNRLPLVGSARRHWALARFCQVFHSALLAAIRMQECLRLAGASSGSGAMAAAASRAEVMVAEGQRLGVSLRAVGGFPRLFVDSVSTAEESGTLDRELGRWVKAETQMAVSATDCAATWMPKIAYGLAVLFIVWRIISMMSGYYAGIMSIGEN